MTAKDIQITLAKEKAMKEQDNLTQWRQQMEELRDRLLPITTAKHVYIDREDGFCPYMRYVKFDALDQKDYPNGIAENSMFVTFKIDLFTKKVEVFRTGHIWLSPKDKAEVPHYKYLAMKSATNVLTDKGGKKFRKQSFKDMADLTKRMETYYQTIMQAVTEYTGGYPYKEGIEQPTQAKAA